MCHRTHGRANARSQDNPGGIVKVEGLGDGPTHGQSAIAKLRGLRLTMPPGGRILDISHQDFAIALAPVARERDF